MTKGPLDGLRVVDCSWGTAGPRATGLLADYGADVLWVEPPGGDRLRRLDPAAASVFNRGKRSVEVDLKDPDQRDRVAGLVARADVLVHSWRPGVAARLGLDYADLHDAHPGLVVCSISGFGPDGPWRELPGHEALIHALVGTMAEQPGHRDGPIFEALPFASIGAAYLAVIGVLAALYRRHDDAVGRHVETSLLDGALAYLSMLWGARAGAAGGMPAPGAHRIVARSFRCQDDEYIGVHTGAVGAFGRLMVALGLDDRIPPSATGLDLGVPLTAEQLRILETDIHDIFASRPRADWVRLLRDADVCAIEHLRPCLVFDTEQAKVNEMVVVVDDPVLGRVEQVAPPAKLANTPGEVRSPAPRVGADDAAALDPTTWPSGASGECDERPILDGVRILDLGAFYAGPYSSRLLADLGADVIKVEPVVGDPLRGMERPFFSAQAGKRSLAANLKDEGLAPAVQRLLAWADVVHHNMRPGAAERLGLGYDQVRAVNPSIVYLYAPGWGSSGPDRLRQSFAPMLSNYVGIGLECAGQFNPPLFPTGNEDPGNGLLGAVGVLLALLHRQRTGEGQYVENPQLNATMAHMAHAVRLADGTVLNADRLDPLQFGFGPFERLYETADGWVCLVVPTERQRRALGKVAGADVQSGDDYAVSTRLAEALATRPSAELVADLTAAGVPAVVPVARNMVTFLEDPTNERSGRVAVVPDGTKGTVREIDKLVRISGASPPPHRLAPGLGEHTDELLRSFGYDEPTIADLRIRGGVA